MYGPTILVLLADKGKQSYSEKQLNCSFMTTWWECRHPQYWCSLLIVLNYHTVKNHHTGKSSQMVISWQRENVWVYHIDTFRHLGKNRSAVKNSRVAVSGQKQSRSEYLVDIFRQLNKTAILWLALASLLLPYATYLIFTCKPKPTQVTQINTFS